MSALKLLCTQCSLHVWAIISSSTSVISRLCATNQAWMAFISVRSSANRLSEDRESRESSSMIPRSYCSTGGTRSCPSGKMGLISPNSHRSINEFAKSTLVSFNSEVSFSQSASSSQRIPVAALLRHGIPISLAALTSSFATVSVTPGFRQISTIRTVSGSEIEPCNACRDTSRHSKVSSTGSDKRKRPRRQSSSGAKSPSTKYSAVSRALRNIPIPSARTSAFNASMRGLPAPLVRTSNL